MCGIAGYIGSGKTDEILLNILKKLEYRGYDSAGIAAVSKGEIGVLKECGKIENLIKKANGKNIFGKCGIGHTRWATHGAVNLENCHPHLGRKTAVVHNGIIENYKEIKEELEDDGIKIKSESDSAVIPYLIEKYYEGDFEKAVRMAADRLEGSFAFCAVSAYDEGKILAVASESPLVIGVSGKEIFVSSDMAAISSYTNEFYFLQSGEVAALGESGVKITDFYGKTVNKEAEVAYFDKNELDKGEFAHFMLKEIYQQPAAILKTVSHMGEREQRQKIAAFFENLNRIYIVACGTACHAGLVGKTAIEKAAGIPCEVCLSSEFRYTNPLLSAGVGVILISQSGETADTIAAAKLCREKAVKTMAITNVFKSTLSRIADFSLHTLAGAEVAVASTKAYTTALAALYMISLTAGDETLFSDAWWRRSILTELEKIHHTVKKTLDCSGEILLLAKEISKEKQIFYMGRGLDFAASLEGALKMKEITYIHAEAFAGGEIKHGPIALIKKGSPIIFTLTDECTAPKSINAIKETAARGARVFGIITENCRAYANVFEKAAILPHCQRILSPIISGVAHQLLAYYAAKDKKLDVDKPRNLAKSVTVE